MSPRYLGQGYSQLRTFAGGPDSGGAYASPGLAYLYRIRGPAQRRWENASVRTAKIVYWEEEGAWIGYLEEFPDYWTQGDTLEDLESHLCDLYKDLTSNELPGIRRVGGIVVA